MRVSYNGLIIYFFTPLLELSHLRSSLREGPRARLQTARQFKKYIIPPTVTFGSIFNFYALILLLSSVACCIAICVTTPLAILAISFNTSSSFNCFTFVLVFYGFIIFLPKIDRKQPKMHIILKMQYAKFHRKNALVDKKHRRQNCFYYRAETKKSQSVLLCDFRSERL